MGQNSTDVDTASQCMAQASEAVLNGFALRSSVQCITYPQRYVDVNGIAMWERVQRLLEQASVC